MKTILFVNGTDELGARLESALLARQYRVKKVSIASLADALDGYPEHVDLVIIWVSGDNSEFWRAISNLRRFLSTQQVQPSIFCVANIYRGPEFEFRIERHGASLVYV